MELLAKVKGECDKAKKVVTDDTDYNAKLTPFESDVNTKIGNVIFIRNTYGAQPAMEARAIDIRDNHLGRAKTKAASRLYAEAVELIASGVEKLKSLTTDIGDVHFSHQKQTAAEAALTTLESHGGAAGVATEIAALRVRKQDAIDLRAQGRYSAANRIWSEIQWVCTDATKVAVLHEAYVPKLATAKARMVTCTSKVSGLSPAVEGITEKLNEIQTRFIDAAETNVQGREYAGTTKLLDEVDTQCTAVETLVTQHEQYVTDLAAAEQELVPLTHPVVADDVKRIRKDRIDAVKALVAALDYKPALALLAKVKPGRASSWPRSPRAARLPR